jgi:proteinaceous RNase P
MEFTAMMSVYGREKKTCEENGFRMLRKMKSKVRTCGKELIESVERFFKAEPNAWRCETVENVESSSGRFEVSSENTIIGSSSDNNNNNNNNNNNSNNSEKKQTFNLKRVGLNEVESKELIASVGKLAREREAGANFDDFCNWLEAREAKVQCIVDGANVGMANQNFAGSRFHFGQLDNVVEECRRRYCVCSTSDASEASKQRPVVFLHQRRTKDHAAKHQFGEKILNKLRQNKEIFVTPHGSNDDWYWLYAALVAGEDAVLISNDEMRDHVFQMLPDPNLLRRWKERHQVRFSVTKGEVELYEPAVFTTCIQENEEEEYWMIPFVEDDDEEKENDDDDDDDDEKWLFCCKKQ